MYDYDSPTPTPNGMRGQCAISDYKKGLNNINQKPGLLRSIKNN
jgi:hypothetical protein